MEIEGLFHIEDRQYVSKEEFHSYLAENYDPEAVPHHLTVLTGVTKYDSQQLERKLKEFGFEIHKRFGIVLQIKNVFKTEEMIEAYLLHDEKTGVVYIYTNYRKTEEIPKIQDFFEKDKDTYYLFIKPKLLRRITYKLIEEFEDIKILDFVARRVKDSKISARIRPSYERSISYWGDDGRDTLREMESYYGVLPNMVTFQITGMAKFKIDSRGLFTYFKGTKEGTELFLNIIDEVTNEARNLLNAYDRTRFEIISVNTDTKTFSIPISTPSSIVLENPLAYSEIDAFEKALDDAGYTTITSIAAEGSLFFSADLISDIGNRIRIKATKNKIKLYPDRDRNLHTFMKFYKFILEKVDSNAEIVL